MISAATSLLLMFTVCRISVERVRISFSNIEKNTIRELFKYSGHAIGRSGSMIFMYTTLALLIGKVGTARDIAVYEVGMRISGFLRSLLAGAQNVFLPVVTSLFAAGHIDKMKAVIRKGTHISCVMTFVPLILLYIYTREILVLWLKDDIFPEMILVLRVLIISEASRGFFGIWIPSLVGMGHLRLLTIAAITTAVLAITVELILFQSFVIIPLAAAVALVIALWIYMGFWLPAYGLYKTKISPLEYFKSSLLGPVLAAVISIAVLWLLNHTISGIHWLLMFAASGIIVLLIFSIISLRVEAAEFLVIIKRRLSKNSKETI
jgi:O-antigen/teichoic acid export membrane protein